jgi:adenosylcobinamide kinase/adenosylcobinamide-phosphate guanylyltransferase
MKMIIGGAFQGKTSYASMLTKITKEQMTDGATCEFDTIFTTPVIYHFHEYIKRLIQVEQFSFDLPKQLMEKNPNLVIVSNELGYGIVPIDAFDRNYREMTGRICCMLAEQSEEVYRVVCGLAQKLKG